MRWLAVVWQSVDDDSSARKVMPIRRLLNVQ